MVTNACLLQYKTGKTLSFKPLSQALADPGEFLLSDFSKASHPCDE